MLRTTFITFLKPAAVLINLGFTSAQNGGQTVQGSDLSKCPYATESYVSPSGTNYEICPGTDYRGDNSVVINGIGSRQDCAAQCGNNQDCTKAVYDGTNQICVVKTTANDATQVWYENQRFDVIQVINTYNPATQGSWSDLIQFPLVPVACYTVPEYPESTRIMCWSAWGYDAFGQDTPEGGGGGYTQFMDFNYKTGAVSNQTISNTHHDMFCPGISALEDGRIMITGGADASVTSFYDPTTNAFTRGPDMQIARGYQTSVTLSDGKVFTIGGGYTGPRGNKNGEIFDPKANTWTLLPDAAVAPMLTTDAEGVWREDNHGWLFPRSDGWVFQAGPSPTQHWYSTNGTGSVVQAGQRPDADDQMCGMSVMYDVDVILSAGGSTDYTNSPATAMAHITTLGNPGDPVQVERIGDMAHPRGFANIVVLPDGSSLIVGGQTRSVAFTDMGGVLAPELFNPQSRTFTSMAPMAIPRNYHSTAVLLADGRVFSGGGGLCNDGPAGSNEDRCDKTVNHADGQIFSPPYLYQQDGSPAPRPVIDSISDMSPRVGGTLNATMSSDTTDAMTFSMIRMGSATHSVNSDQRRVPVSATASGTTYTIQLPSDSGVLIPGSWYLFALNPAGVPSEAKTVRIDL